MANSINTNISAYYAQANITRASAAASTSVSRLSSGNFITKASDDVARLSIGTSFATTVRTLRQALVNAAQGSSLLQVADGALGQVTEILQRQKTLAVQAGSGNLSNTDRGFLNQEFQALTQQIDFIASTSSFNGVNLLDGGLDSASVFTNTASQATAGTLTVSFSNNILDAETVEINGVTLTAESTVALTSGLEFTVGATIAETVENLAARLNLIAEDNSLVDGSNITAANKLALAEAKYTAVGNNLVITSRTGGALSSNFVIDTSGATTSATTNGEATASGKYAGFSFNLFSTTAVTSRTQVLSNATAAVATPFDTTTPDALKITVDGVQHTLYTFTAGAGTGTGSEHTFNDIINGINANSGTTGVSAEAVFDGTNYNIRLDYESQTGLAILDAGDAFVSGTYILTGANVDLGTTTTVSSGGADLTKSIVSSEGYINLFNADLLTANVATQAATVTHASTPAAATPFLVGEEITATINGVNHVLHTFATNDGLDNIVAGINAGTGTHGVYAVVDAENGTDLNIRLYLSDPAGGGITALSTGVSGTSVHSTAVANSTFTEVTTNNAGTRVSESALVGGTDNGLGIASTGLTSSSAVGDSILTDLSSIKANSSIIFSANATAGDTITFGDKVFYFTSTAKTSAASNEILIGSTIAETLDNAVERLNAYGANSAVGSEAYEFNQVHITRDNNILKFEGKHGSNVLQIDGTAVTIASSDSTNTAVTSANLSNAASTFGVKVDGISNSEFFGTISGFTAAYTGTSDQATLSVKVGDYTYTASKVDLTIAANTTIRFLSDTLSDGSNGGYFDVQFKANEITTLTSQAQADVVASRLDAAFSGLTFLQTRNVSSYTPGGAFTVNGSVTGSLLGTKVTARLSDFSSLDLTGVSVSTATGSQTDAKVTLTIGGETYSTRDDIGTTLGANQTYRLISASDADLYIEFTVGSTAIALDNADKAAAFEDALRNAFGATDGSASLSFQIGTSSDQSLSVSIRATTSSSLFNGASLSIATLADAATASDAIDLALSTVTSIRANVGALQSRFNFASANIQISVQNQDASRSELLDTDIAEESTKYATAQVGIQAGISVLAQTNQQLQALLKLLG